MRECWASLYTPRAIAYRANLGATDAAMGVTVQTMVDADVSGVMFTCNPVSGDPSMVAVNASWGLGLAVVGGETNPDDYLVSKVTGEVVRRAINSKDDRVRRRRRRPRHRTGRGAGRSARRGLPRRRTVLAALVDGREARSSATSAPTRTSSGRSSAVPAGTAHPPDAPRDRGRDAPAVSGSAIALVMDAFGAAADRALMPLSDDDVREILRLIDEAEDEELEVETETFSLFVRQVLEPRPAPRPRSKPTGKTVGIVDTTTRDGNQSLWSATGLTTEDIVSIGPTIDRVGFHAMDFSSSTHMAVAVRFHQEDPWERLRLVRAAMPNTPLSYITTGMRFISWVPCDEDLMRLSFRCVVRNGIRRFQFADPTNDPDRLKGAARMAREEGVEEIVVGLTYSVSEVHTHEYYAERAAGLADCEDMDRLYLKDPGGLLTADAVRELAPHFLAAAGDRPAELHSHCTIGLAPFVYMEGLKAGFQVLHTAVEPLARGTSNPAADTTLRNLEAEGFSHELDLEALAAMTKYFRRLGSEKGLPVGQPQEFDATYYRHQLAGGMVSTTKRMLDEQHRPELFDAVLEEVGRVRAEMGYPIIVTPVSQLVATQAVRNVMDGERWANVPDEIIRYFLGHYGDPAAPWSEEVADRVLSRPRAEALRDLEPLQLEGARRRFGERISDEELLLRLTMPEEQVDAMVANRRARSPVATLLKEVATRESVSHVRVAADDRTVEWRR